MEFRFFQKFSDVQTFTNHPPTPVRECPKFQNHPLPICRTSFVDGPIVILVYSFVKLDEKWPSYDHGQVFEIWTSNLFCLVFTLTLIYKPSLKSIRPKLAILSPKNSKNSPKWPYLKTPFCPSVIHQKAYSSYIFQ